MTGLGAGVVALIWLFGVVLAILWIALPFAVFGVKKRLDAILAELRKLNQGGGR